MKAGWPLIAAVTIAASGCAAREVKVGVDQTPEAVRKAIQTELKGAELEDIAQKRVNGRTVYETDILRDGHKWEVLIDEDGKVLHKLEEGSTGARAADSNQRAQTGETAWRETFDISKSDLLPQGNNPYITMQPGRVIRLKNGIDTLTITVLPDVQNIDGVRTGSIEERETKNGTLVEISRNFFATHTGTGDVYYFGEDVDNYKDNKIISHDSAWRAGVHDARFGLMIPAKPAVGQRFYQEIAPKVAMDRVEVVSVNETVKTPAGTFDRVVHLRETTPLESDVSHKDYAPGIGLIKDDEFELAERP